MRVCRSFYGQDQLQKFVAQSEYLVSQLARHGGNLLEAAAWHWHSSLACFLAKGFCRVKPAVGTGQ